MIPEITTTSLESLRGFQVLSPWQKRIISMSLLFEKRYQRSKNRPTKYMKTLMHYIKLSCHLSVYIVESQKISSNIFDIDIPDDFYEATYYPHIIRVEYEVLQIAASLVYPSVIHIAEGSRIADTPKSVVHTVLALDFCEGQFIAWEKRGNLGQFRLVTAEELIRDREGLYWGSRPLRIK